jgi:RimJ/RimL family protein N-acetyltransferase
MKNIILQRATVDDVDTFLSLEKSVAHLKTYSAIVDIKEAEKEIEENIVYIIMVDDKAVGSIEYKREDNDVVYLSGLVVSPDFWRQGIARQAMEKIFAEIGEVKKIHLVTHPHNSSAIKLYLSFGFVIDGWKDNCFGDGEPRIVMMKIK